MKVTEEQREAVLRLMLADRKYREIAVELGMPHGTVGTVANGLIRAGLAPERAAMYRPPMESRDITQRMGINVAALRPEPDELVLARARAALGV